jgi:hypothetical protein
VSNEINEIGPIDYLVIEFPGSHMTGEGLPLLVDLVERSIIRILDLILVAKDQDGTVAALELADVTGDGKLDLTVFEGAASGLLGDDEVADAGNLLQPGDSAAVLVYENLWAAPLAAALRRGGAQLVAGGRIPVPDIVAALDALESRQATA